MTKPASDPIIAQIMGCNIRKFRKILYDGGRKTFTQAGCADKIGVKQQQWAAWESGALSAPSPANQRKIAEVLEVSLAELRGEAIIPRAGGDSQINPQNAEELDIIFTLQESLSKVMGSLSVVGKHVASGGALREYDDLSGLVRVIRVASGLGQVLADALEGSPSHAKDHDRTA